MLRYCSRLGLHKKVSRRNGGKGGRLHQGESWNSRIRIRERERMGAVRGLGRQEDAVEHAQAECYAMNG